MQAKTDECLTPKPGKVPLRWFRRSAQLKTASEKELSYLLCALPRKMFFSWNERMCPRGRSVWRRLMSRGSPILIRDWASLQSANLLIISDLF